VHEVTGAHDKRILGSGVSPDGCTVVTGAADESLKVGRSVVLLCTNSSLTGRLANDAVLEDLGGQGDSQAENDGEGREWCGKEQA
jgi:WD40 repeat protein